ncbi:hypothetical protein MPSEU_000689100 [Mayamaea pseudoterrestris]|nr:hypothetical protein MPSEU_000689100 [Mayamaea pseudoterrestris]
MASYSLVDNTMANNFEMESANAVFPIEEKKPGENTYSSLLLFEHNEHGSDEENVSNSPSLFEEKQVEGAVLKKQLRRISIAAFALLLVGVLSIIVYLYAPPRNIDNSSSSAEQENMDVASIARTGRFSSCDFGNQFFPDFVAISLDEELGLDQDIISKLAISMSKDGSKIAITAPEWNNSVRLIRNLGSPDQMTLQLNVPLAQKISSMALSGDGNFIVAGDVFYTVLFDVNKMEQLPFLDVIGNYNRSEDSTGFVISDVAINYDATRLAIAYGTNDTSTASFGMGDDRPAWQWTNYTPALTVIYEGTARNGMEEDWKDSQFPMSYQTDNFGLQLAMSSNGKRVFQSTEHDIRNHQMNFIYRDDSMDAWYGAMDFFALLDNDQCKDTVSDVTVSDKGTVAVVALQCLTDHDGVSVYLYPVVESSPQSDPMSSTWNRHPKPLVRKLDTNSLKPMSVTMAGDATLTILAVDGVLLERFDGKPGVSSDGVGGTMPADTTITVQISQDANVVALGTVDATNEGSVCIFKK